VDARGSGYYSPKNRPDKGVDDERFHRPNYSQRHGTRQSEKQRPLEEHEYLVARVGDEYFVTDAKCPHLGGPSPKGTLEGTILTCPRHDSQFDLRDGRVVRWTDWQGVTFDHRQGGEAPPPAPPPM